MLGAPALSGHPAGRRRVDRGQTRSLKTPSPRRPARPAQRPVAAIWLRFGRRGVVKIFTVFLPRQSAGVMLLTRRVDARPRGQQLAI